MKKLLFIRLVYEYKFNFIYLSILFIAASAMFLPMAIAKQGQEKPNIVFILTDDQPYNYMGCVGNELAQTPNIDKLASEGVLFTNYHISSAICTPSRVSMFLGQYERKHGVNFNSGTSVSPEAWKHSYPVILRQEGYFTGYIGKNHSPIGEGGYQSKLLEKSFDYWYAASGHLGFYPKERHDIFKNAEHDTQVEIIQEGVDDFFDNNEYNLKGALHFLNARPKDKPFCLTVCFNLPHDAGTGTMELRPTDDEMYRTLYRDKDIPLSPLYIAKEDIINPKLPGWLWHVEDRQDSYAYVENPEACKERMIRKMEAMTGIDRLVGKLRDRLQELKLDKNTIIVFTSDHGQFMGEFGLGGKAMCYEICTHVPMIFYNPLISKEHRGIMSNELVQSIDLAPTMVSLAGGIIPDPMQGKDISGILKGEAHKVRDFIFTENLWSTSFGNPRCEAVQDKEWKYIRYYRNDNLSAKDQVKLARQLGIDKTKLLYGVHDPGIALYRSFIEGPVNGEKPVYEELYHLSLDKNEIVNLVSEAEFSPKLNEMRAVWSDMIKEARGVGEPMVLRYTLDSKVEAMKVVPAE